MSGGGVGARLGGAPFCNPKTDRVEAAAPAKSERERVTSGVKQGLGVRRRGRCVRRHRARWKSRRGAGTAH